MHLLCDRYLGIVHEAAQITPHDVGLYIDPALAVVTAHLVQTLREAEADELTQRYRRAALLIPRRQHDRHRTQDVQITSVDAGQSNHHIEAAVALEYLARLASGQRGRHRISHILHGQAIAGNRCAIKRHVEGREATGLGHTHIRCPGNLLQHSSNFVCAGGQRRQVFAVDLHRHVAAHTTNQLVEAHLDRLCGVVVVAH